MEKVSTLEGFEKALFSLDSKLSGVINTKLEIRAIGGFAMMYHGIRNNGYTIDIDSLTYKFDLIVSKLIEEVGEELGLEDDWLNTDCAMLEGFMNELAQEITWRDSKYVFKNIDLKVPDILGLIRSKAKAIHDGGLVPRSTDKKDLIDLLRNMEVNSIEEVNSNEELKFIKSKYDRCYKYLCDIECW